MAKFPRTPTQRFLHKIGACKPAREWVGKKSLKTAWLTCEDRGWMWWLVAELGWTLGETLGAGRPTCAEWRTHVPVEKLLERAIVRGYKPQVKKPAVAPTPTPPDVFVDVDGDRWERGHNKDVVLGLGGVSWTRAAVERGEGTAHGRRCAAAAFAALWPELPTPVEHPTAEEMIEALAALSEMSRRGQNPHGIIGMMSTTRGSAQPILFVRVKERPDLFRILGAVFWCRAPEAQALSIRQNPDTVDWRPWEPVVIG